MKYFVRFSFVNKHNGYLYQEKPQMILYYNSIVEDFVVVSLEDELQIQEEGFLNLIEKEVIKLKKLPKHDEFDIINISELRSLINIKM